MNMDKGPYLLEAAVYAERFRGQLLVVKLGGELLEQEAVLDRLVPQIEVLYRLGLRPIIVHGGGVQVDRACQERGVSFEKRGGRRLTSPAVLQVLVDVVAGDLNERIKARLAALGIPSNGYKEGASSSILCKRRPPSSDEHGEMVDWGEVGDVSQIRPEFLSSDDGEAWTIPVLPSLGVLADGSAVNVNADSVAARLAVALDAVKLVLLTGVAGVMPHPGAAGPISEIRVKALRTMIGDGTASGGMQAKLQEGLAALEGGVPQVHIISGRAPFTLLRELFTREGCGSLLLPDHD
jgi:acetylglutamate kinase